MAGITKAPKKLQTLQIRLDDDTVAKLREIALEEHRTVANLISKMVQDAIKAREGK